jgi:predicted permease
MESGLGCVGKMMLLRIFLWSFNAVAPVLFLLAAGWFIAFRGHVHEEDRTFLNRLCFKYLLPCQLFSNTLSIDFSSGYNTRLLLFCGGGLFVVAISAWAILTFVVSDRPRRAIFIVSAFRANNILYGLPLAANLFGAEGTAVAVMVYPVTIIFFNIMTVVVMVYFSQGGGGKMDKIFKKTAADIVRNPLITGCLLGTLCAALRVPVPLFLKNGINSAGAAATPVALLLLGSQIDMKALTGNIKPALAACAIRLLLVPSISLTAMVFAGFRGPELSALMVAFAAPSAVTNMVMARNYDIAPAFAAQTVYLSTILSGVTIFLIIVSLRVLNLM